jgi:hypothetical protein
MRVKIGVTVNLANYENIHVEIEGDEREDDLITRLDQILAKLGRGNADTAARVDAYRRRVLVPNAPLPPPPRDPVVVPVENLEPIPEVQVQTPTPTAPRATGTSCEICGKELSSTEVKFSELFSPGRAPRCSKCLKK